ncbi:Oligopeptide transport system permease protein OppC (TC 3.A.1.5.1) [[Actinomadura] parvosata subsp. kistnae]|uniref:ABC transporter permease n=2 Tax=Nonomuraea TaxID=83681 RepID=A0A1U9ZTW6_9ACTN|nr:MULTISPECIES: ABC transporter permease [unclassified Nonomuraea]AQZ61395.1 ABC transporter permease [Nonomuraea sp. ATCC 55076]NJP88438.1 ABC transporter permease [Nonomuraea sp. FMUSA5-5]SPL98076.1 Oligopeptide transport system permease protein OppC (TC 3.A.1.5.1) [Actinomadura parvosata subsp. kistnae]
MAISAQAAGAAQGMTVVARTQTQLVRRRFFRHRAALIGMLVFGGIVVLAFSSIGFGPLPGWWDKSYLATGAVVDQGRPTLSLVPQFLGGEGLRWGEHPFGQDNIGIDYFALTMRGTQQSIIVAFIVGFVATTVGTLAGAFAGYFRKKVEAILMRLTDVMITIPVLIIAAIVGRSFGDSGIVVLAICIGLVTWPTLGRLIRGEFLSLREKEFVEAARALGTSSSRIIFRHILPNTVGVIIVSATLAIANAVLLESALSFLGVGVQPPDVSLGQLIDTYRSAMTTRPWLFWWPGVFIIAIALSINFIGDGLRDAFDPRQTRVRA